jgi:hypothetical protein
VNRRQGRWALGTAGSLALLALILRLWPVGVPTVEAEASAAPVTASPGDWVGGADGAELYSGIVEGNVFAPDRTPPPLRAGDAVVAEPRVVPAAPRRPRYRLSGIVQGPDGLVALIDADPLFPGAELYQVGDSVGPYVLEEATDSLVVLRLNGQTQILRLDTISGRIP